MDRRRSRRNRGERMLYRGENFEALGLGKRLEGGENLVVGKN